MTIGDDAAVDLLERMVRTPSPCGGEDAVAAVILAAMQGAGFDATRDAVGNVVGTVGPSDGPEVVILGHMDTVPGMVPVERRDGTLRGRGTVDAKGPLATGIVAAARAVARTNTRITVIGAVQEEGPSVGARYLVDRPAPQFLVIAEPSGWDAVVLGYKGSLRFTVEITQPCTHTALPEPTAPERAVTYWNDLVAWAAGYGTATGADTFHRLVPALIAMHTESDGLYETASLQIGLRLPPGLSVEDAQAAARALLPDAMYRFNPGEPAVRGGKGGPLVASFLRAIRAEHGKPRFKVKTGTSDMNVVGPVWNCAMLAYGPGDSRLDHTPDEHVRIDDYLRAIRVLTCVLEDL